MPASAPWPCRHSPPLIPFPCEGSAAVDSKTAECNCPVCSCCFLPLPHPHEPTMCQHAVRECQPASLLEDMGIFDRTAEAAAVLSITQLLQCTCKSIQGGLVKERAFHVITGRTVLDNSPYFAHCGITQALQPTFGCSADGVTYTLEVGCPTAALGRLQPRPHACKDVSCSQGQIHQNV